MAKKKPKNNGFFEDKDVVWWQKHWKEMPEFIQEDLTPHKTIYLHFRNEEDVQKFAKLLNQKIHKSTKWLWYPKAEKDWMHTKSLYVDEEIKNES